MGARRHPRWLFLAMTSMSVFAGMAFADEGAEENTDESANPTTPKSKPAAKRTPKPEALPDLDRPSVETQSKVKEKVERRSKTEVVKDKISGTGFGVFGGADMGLVFTAPASKLYKGIEGSQIGYSPTLKFGGSVFTKRIVLDFGLGFQYTSYSGTLIALPSIDDLGEVGFTPVNTPYTNTQKTLYIETAGRLRIKTKFQLGILGNILFSSTSAGFSSIPDIEPPEKYIANIGPQFVYESQLKDIISRVSASFTLSLTGSNRTAYIATVGAGLGTYIVNPVTTVKTQSETKFRTKVTREVIQLKAQSADVTDNVSFIFDSQMVNFKLNSAVLNPKSAGFITALGEMFVRERDIWGKLMIEGHTDSRGSQAYNVKLSTMRARSVLDQLEKAGVARESMEAVGLGASQLLIKNETSDVDYARNRRVEIRILGLKDARSLQKYVDEIQSKFFGRPAEVRTVPVPKRVTPEGQESGTQAPVWDPGLESQDSN